MPQEVLSDVKEKKAKSSYLNKLTRIPAGWNIVLLVLLLIIAFIVIVPLVSVSYTHLDVYKRQV